MKSTFYHVVTWLSICIVILAGHWFWYSVVANKSAAVAGLQNQIDTKNERASRIESARTALAEIADDEVTVQSYFVPETGVVSFIDNLEKHAIAQAATLDVLSVSVSDSETKPTLILAITIDGTFDSVMRAVGAIEYAPYDLSISKLSLEKNTKNSWQASLELRVGSVAASTATSTGMAEQKTLSSSRTIYEQL